MDKQGSAIEALFHEKMALYWKLLDTLKQEKESIVNVDVDALWKISERKQSIASKVAGVRVKILEQMTRASIDHNMDAASFHAAGVLSLLPEKTAKPLRKPNAALASLKNEIQARLDENKRFVREYLAVLNDLIGIITDAGNPKPVYGKSRRPEQMASNLFLDSEV